MILYDIILSYLISHYIILYYIILHYVISHQITSLQILAVIHDTGEEDENNHKIHKSSIRTYARCNVHSN